MRQSPNIFALMIFLGLFLYIAQFTSPLWVLGELQWLTLGLYFLIFLVGNELTIIILNGLAAYCEWLSAHQTTGRSGTARFAKVRDIKPYLSQALSVPFWGRLADRSKKLLRIPYVSNALTVAPAGSGKGIYSVVNNIIAIRDSKVIPDFKGELSVMLAELLRKRGEAVHILNPPELFKALLGESACYNPLDMITDELHRAGGLLDIVNRLREISAQLLPEPSGKVSENKYFRDGSRNLIGMGIIIQCMIEEYYANLGTVSLLLEDRTQLEHHLRWISGVDLEGKPLPEGPMPIEQTAWAANHHEADVRAFAVTIRARAANILKMMCGNDGRTFESFISGAQQALAPYNFGRLSAVTSRSSFSMNDLKEGNATTIFLLVDSSEMEAYAPYVALMQWCIFTAIKRHPNKSRPVYAILDEANNYKINKLDQLLTWGRGYGLRIHIIIQGLMDFKKVYGEDALETLLAETEVKQFLPGQRSPKTLAIIEKLLGEQSVIASSFASHEPTGGKRESTSEAARPLLKSDEIRRSKKGILIVEKALPVLFEPISYAEIDPWRKQVGVNPFHNKPFLKKVKVRFKEAA